MLDKALIFIVIYGAQGGASIVDGEGFVDALVSKKGTQCCTKSHSFDILIPLVTR